MRLKRKRRRSRAGRNILLFLLVLILVSFLLILPFRWLVPPTTAFIQHARQTGLGGAAPCQGIDWQWVDWSRISPQMGLAVIAAEDQRFNRHRGLDIEAISSALQDRTQKGRVRGGSTLTQQLVKNLYLWPGQSWVRKGIEAWMAVLLDLSWPKRRILEVYMNVVQFGDCTFGVEAASRRFFYRSALKLSARQAARLAAVLPNPVRLRVDADTAYVRQRTAWILEQMNLLGGTPYLRKL